MTFQQRIALSARVISSLASRASTYRSTGFRWSMTKGLMRQLGGEVALAGTQVKAILAVRPVKAIVISQDCDISRSQDISLCEIREFILVERKAKDTKTAKGWVSILSQHARLNLKWFYLPPDEKVGFSSKMAVDFTVTLRVPRLELEGFRVFRKGRLNSIADEHFRERLAEFFRRYPYDEWYPDFDEAELAEYKKTYPDSQPFSWQKPPVASEFAMKSDEALNAES